MLDLNNYALEFRSVSAGYKTDAHTQLKVLSDFNLKIDRKYRTICLTGPDGAGKSTLLKLLCGVKKQDKGEIFLKGLRADRTDSEFIKKCSYMSQTLGLYLEMSVSDNLNFFSSLKGIDPIKDRDYLDSLLDRVGLLQFKDRTAGNLSGGMKQKLATACAIAPKPEFLILDEPTVGVDPLSRQEIWSIIEEYQEHSSCNCIFSSAYLEEAQKSDYVVILNKGEILLEGESSLLISEVKDQTYSAKSDSKNSLLLARELITKTTRFSKNSFIADICPKGGSVSFITKVPMSLCEVEKEFSTLTSLSCQIMKRPALLEDLYILKCLEKSHFSPRQQQISNDSFNDETVIEVKDIKKTFGSFTAVARSSFNVHKGEIFGLLGPNGAGKTTTFRMLCALIAPTQGSIKVNGYNLAKAKIDARSTIGYVSQKFSLYRNLTAEQNLEYFGLSYGLSCKKLKNRIKELIDEFSLTDFASIKSAEL
ncbi:MAG: ATP-binding cassette domain-containing protein, partial [Succinivibrio sp.]